MYFRIISFTLLAPSLWAMINQFKANKNDNLKVIKIDNSSFEVKVKPLSWSRKNQLVAAAMKFGSGTRLRQFILSNL